MKFYKCLYASLAALILVPVFALAETTPLPNPAEMFSCDGQNCQKAPGFGPLDLILISQKCVVQFDEVLAKYPKSHLETVWTPKAEKPSTVQDFHYQFTEAEPNFNPVTGLFANTQKPVAEVIVKQTLADTHAVGALGFAYSFSYSCEVK